MVGIGQKASLFIPNYGIEAYAVQFPVAENTFGIIIAKLAVALCGVYGTITNDTALSGVVDQTYIAKFLLDICPW